MALYGETLAGMSEWPEEPWDLDLGRDVIAEGVPVIGKGRDGSERLVAVVPRRPIRPDADVESDATAAVREQYAVAKLLTFAPHLASQLAYMLDVIGTSGPDAGAEINRVRAWAARLKLVVLDLLRLPALPAVMPDTDLADIPHRDGEGDATPQTGH